MAATVALVVKYDTPGHELRGMGGAKETITRREMNERFGQDQLNPDIDPPDDGEWLWDVFWHLSSRRHQGMNGPQPLTYRDVSTWSGMTGTIVLREELSILMRMDTAFLNAVAEEHKDQERRREEAKGN